MNPTVQMTRLCNLDEISPFTVKIDWLSMVWFVFHQTKYCMIWANSKFDIKTARTSVKFKICGESAQFWGHCCHFAVLSSKTWLQAIIRGGWGMQKPLLVFWKSFLFSGSSNFSICEGWSVKVTLYDKSELLAYLFHLESLGIKTSVALSLTLKWRFSNIYDLSHWMTHIWILGLKLVDS